MKILMVGGGSGGHITPIMSVIREIFKEKPKTQIDFWTDRKYYKNILNLSNELAVLWGDEQRRATKKNPYIRVRKIFAGKFKRYYGLKLKDYFDDGGKTFFSVVFGNLSGFVGFCLGFIQAFLRLAIRKRRPDVIFLKGGFVGLPVGMVAGILKIPYVIHESDAMLGLTNRILKNQAKKILTGVPIDENKYSEIKEKTEWVGIPVAPEFRNVSEAEQRKLKRSLGFLPDKNLVVVTGGSQGSEHINTAIGQILPKLLEKTSVGLVAGRRYYDEMLDLKRFEKWENAKLISDFRMWNFSSKMDEILGAADLIVSRAGATTIAELASLKKAVILVPFEKLPGGHQTKNAESLVRQGAVEMVLDSKMEERATILLHKIVKLLESKEKRESLATNLHKLQKRDAARRVAEILITEARKK